MISDKDKNLIERTVKITPKTKWNYVLFMFLLFVAILGIALDVAIDDPSHEKRVFGLAVSSSGELVASGSSDGAVKIWRRGACLRTFDCEAGEVSSLSFSPDDTQLLIGADDCIALVSVLDMAFLWRKDAKALSRNVSFSSDGRLVASVKHVQNGSDADRKVQVYRAADGVLQAQLECDDYELSYVAFLKGGRRIIASGYSNIYVWDVESGALVSSHSFGRGVGFALSADETTIAVGNSTETLTLFDLQTGAPRSRLNLCTGGGYISYPIAFSPDGRMIATGRSGVHLWDVRTGMPLTQLTDKLTCNLQFYPDGKTLVSTQNDGCVKEWDVSKFIPAPDSFQSVALDARDVVLRKSDGDRGQPNGLIVIDEKHAKRFDSVHTLYKSALTGKPPPGGDTLVGFSHIALDRRKGGIHVTEAKVLEYVRRGNHLLIRIKYDYNYAGPDEHWYVTARLPHLEPGTYHASISYDEYRYGQYIRPAADTVFTEFEVK